MIPFTHLAMLITAFFGVDLSDAKMDIEPRYRDPDVVALYCSGFDAETDDFHNNYYEDWYAWQFCLLRDADGELVVSDNAYRLSNDEAIALVEDVWEKYTPWMREQFSRRLFFYDDEDDSDRSRYQLVLAEDWSPQLPLINRGNKKVTEHCPEESYSCALLSEFSVEERKRVGKSVWWWDDRTNDSHPVWTTKLEYKERARIVTPKQNLFVILEHLAWLIDDWRSFLWEGEEATTFTQTEDRRTNGRNVMFRCLALDLYNNYVDDIGEIILWWEESYVELNRLCQVTAPGYAQPVADDED